MILAYPLTAIGQTGATGAAGADGADGDTFPTGTVLFFLTTTAPAGWVRLQGGTIGDASSGATERANADTATLYALFWNNYANAQCAVSGGRGASAAADFAAHKTLTLPDARGYTPVPYKSGTFGTLGGTLGAETHTLTEQQLPAVAGHTHDMSHTHDVLGYSSGSSDFGLVYENGRDSAIPNTANTQGASVSTTGSGGGFGGGQAHNNIQPSIVLGCLIVKL